MCINVSNKVKLDFTKCKEGKFPFRVVDILNCYFLIRNKNFSDTLDWLNEHHVALILLPFGFEPEKKHLLLLHYLT